MSRIIQAALAAAVVVLLSGCGDDEPSTSVSLESPSDGDTVAGSIQLAMAADGVTIEEAGEVSPNAGHFHVIADAGCLQPGAPIGKDADHVHFGGGQSEGVIHLGPGDHELCLQVGDGVHSALDFTDTISVTVAIADRDEWCEVMGQTDELMAELDAIDDFATAQTGFENLARLVAQLSDAIEFVDDQPESEIGGVTASPRGHVNASLAFAANIARAFTTAPDWDAAYAQLDALYEDPPGGSDNELPGGQWIEDNCGIDLED